MSITDYKVLSSSEPQILINEVRSLMSAGWQPVPGYVSSSFNTGAQLCQVMAKGTGSSYTDYNLIVATKTDILNSLINSAILDGWDVLPVGVGGEYPRSLLCQPMVKGGGSQDFATEEQLSAVITSLSAEDGLKMIGRCSDIATLRTIEPTIPGQKIDVVAYYDGWAAQSNATGGGLFVYDTADSTSPDDGVLCFVTTEGKRWKRVLYNNQVNIFDGGLQSITSDQSALLQQIVYLCADKNLNLTGSKLLTIYCKTTVIIPQTLRVNWAGTVIQQHSEMTSGSVLNVARGSALQQTYRAGTPLDNLRVRGKFNSTFRSVPDYTNNVDGIIIGGTGGQTSDMMFSRLEVTGFRRCVRIAGPSSYLNTFMDCKVGIAWERGYSYEATTDSGENIRVISGSVFNCVNGTFDSKGFMNDAASSTLDMVFIGTSFDYNDIDGTLSHSKVSLIDCHCENNNNNAKWYLSSTSGSAKTKLIARGGCMGRGPGVSPTSIPIEDTDGRPSFIDLIGSNIDVSVVDVDFSDYYTAARKSVVVRNVSGQTQRRIHVKPLMDGSPNVGSGIPLIPSVLLNSLYVQGSGSTAYWTLNPGSGSSVSADTSVFSSRDTGSRKVTAGGTTSSGSIVQAVPVKPGKTVICKSDIKTSGLTQGSATGRVIFYANNGTTVIRDIIFPRRITADAANLQEVSWYGQVPAGAYLMQFQDYWTGLPATAVTIWFSGEYVMIY